MPKASFHLCHHSLFCLQELVVNKTLVDPAIYNHAHHIVGYEWGHSILAKPYSALDLNSLAVFVVAHRAGNGFESLGDWRGASPS